MSTHHIVIIHGLNAKPAASVLKDRYLRHLNESTAPLVIPRESVVLAYWANLMGYEPLTPDEDSYSDGVSNFEPYSLWEMLRYQNIATLPKPARDMIEDRLEHYFKADAAERNGVLNRFKSVVFSHLADEVARKIYDRFLPDLDRYFNQGHRDAVKEVLATELDAVPDGGRVCLIAHSMGSIVALDLILNGTRRIDTLITIGSPIGLSVIQRQVGLAAVNRAELKDKIGHWFNLYDRLDKVALDCDLVDDFPEVKPLDVSIRNTYVGKDGERNHHKSYGYLRSAELGEIVRQFVAAP